MPALAIRLLGPQKLALGGCELPRLPTLKSQSLLAYLVLHRSHPHARERLIDLFWGERPEPRARRSLNTALWHIRRLLPGTDYVLSDSQTVQWNPQADTWLDVAELEESLSQSDVAGLQKGLALYRGELAEGLYDDWVIDERYRLEALFADGLARLMAAHERQEAYEAALATALRLQEHDPLREESYRVAMRTYCALGRRSAALAQYERCRRIIREELAAEPAAATTELYEAILSGQLAAVPQVQMAPLPQPAPEVPVPPARNPLDAAPPPPLVGRAREMALLHNLWRQSPGGPVHLVLVGGEAGVGKTRLVEAFAESLRWQGARVLRGRCYEFERTLPYQPFGEALQDIWPTLAPEALRALSSHVRSSLAHLAPELPVPHSSSMEQPLPESGQEQALLFAGVAEFLAQLAAHRPLLVVLEDLHWAGESALALLHYLARQPAEWPMLFVGTYRSEALVRGHPLLALRRRLLSQDQARDVQLARLSAEAVQELLAGLSGVRDAVRPLARRLYRETEGNPFFLIETVRALFAAGVLRIEAGMWQGDLAALADGDLPLPAAVADAVWARADALDDNARQALEVASVLGREFDLDPLSAVLGRDEEATLAALDTLLRQQLVQEGSGTQGRDYAFTHHKIQEVLYSRLPARRRLRLHGQAGAAMERLYGTQADDLANELAFHFEQARQLDPALSEKATHYLLQAGDRARALYAHEEAIDDYRRALALLREAGDPQASGRTLMKLGLTYHTAFRFREARDAYQQGFVLWQRLPQAGEAEPGTPAPHPLRVCWLEPYCLDPGLSHEVASSRIIEELFSGLVALSPELDVVPDVARSWEVLDSGRRYVFHLSEDARWSDGTPVTASDFEYAWQRLLDPATQSPKAEALYDIKGARGFHRGELPDAGAVGVRALDPHTLAVELEAPAGHFLHTMAYNGSYPLPRQALQAHGPAWTEPGRLVCNGPFRLESWARGKSMRLVRNPHYHGRFGGNIDAVDLRFSPDLAQSASLYAAGELDVLYFTQVGLPELSRLRQQYASDYLVSPWLGTIYLAMDVRQPPFDDARVRRAFAQALDRGMLADVVLRGSYAPATGGFVPSGMPGHTEGIALPYAPHEAQRLLATAGYAGGRGLPALEALTPSPIDPLVTGYLSSQWHDVLGVEVTWERLEWLPFCQRLDEAPPNLHISGGYASYPDPGDMLQPIDETAQHNTHWHDPAYDHLVAQARQSLDQQERLALYGQADRLLVEGATLVPLIYARRHMLVKPWVRRYPTSAIRVAYWKDTVLAQHQ